MRMNPAMGLLATLAILPATGAAGGQVHPGRHYGYGYGPGWAAVGHYDYGPPRAVWAHRHGWRHHTLGFFGSSAVAPGSFACQHDPAYRMDPRC